MPRNSELSALSRALSDIRADMAHYRAGGWYGNLGFWIGATARFGNFAYSAQNRVARAALVAAYKGASFPWEFFRSVRIHGKTRVGPGLHLLHPQNIVVSAHSTVGDNCTIYQEVTVGHGPVPGVPRIGDNVTLYAGARVLGGVEVGDDVEVGANAVVTKDVPAGSVVVSPAARAIPRATVEKLRNGGC